MKINLLELLINNKVGPDEKWASGYSATLNQISSINIELDREELAKNLHYLFGNRDCNGKLLIAWREIKKDAVYLNNWLIRADAIISNSNKIIKVVKK